MTHRDYTLQLKIWGQRFNSVNGCGLADEGEPPKDGPRRGQLCSITLLGAPYLDFQTWDTTNSNP
jgi:hypothetical protein